jgi:hypothetical protein
MIDDDPFDQPVDRVPGLSVLETWVDGRPAWTLAEGRSDGRT